jgi:Cof subfamily protein (haloacid dehalogenase superfamily)
LWKPFMTSNAERWLIASDVDGTLTDHSLMILPEVRATIAAAQAKGHIITLATGRMYRATLPFADTLAIDQPLICYQGALVRRHDEVLLHRTVPLEIAHDAIQVAHDRKLHLNAYLDDTLYIEQHTPESAFYEELAPMADPQVVGDMAHFLREEPTKILFVCEEHGALEFLEWAKQRWGDVAQVVQSHPRYVEITHPAASKGAAVMALAEQLGIPRERVLAVGDNHNDISMIGAAGVGVAMGNAAPIIQAVADWVAPTVKAAGLAAAIEKFVL